MPRSAFGDDMDSWASCLSRCPGYRRSTAAAFIQWVQWLTVAAEGGVWLKGPWQVADRAVGCAGWDHGDRDDSVSKALQDGSRLLLIGIAAAKLLRPGRRSDSASGGLAVPTLVIGAAAGVPWGCSSSLVSAADLPGALCACRHGYMMALPANPGAHGHAGAHQRPASSYRACWRW
jgi:hypothetical protein